MNTPWRTGRSRFACSAGHPKFARSLVILGAFLGVFALHSLTVDKVPFVAFPAAQGVAMQVDSQAVSEGLEQVAMVAPAALATDSTDQHHLPCAASLAGSLLMLSALLMLRRQRFGDVPHRATVMLGAVLLHLPVWGAPPLAKLCVLRT